MKGLILAAGQGSRLAELNLKHKSFAVVNKKHIIDYSLDLLRNEGGKELVSEILWSLVIMQKALWSTSETNGREYL